MSGDPIMAITIRQYSNLASLDVVQGTSLLRRSSLAIVEGNEVLL